MSPRLPVLSSRKMLQALNRAGFFIHHASGSHYILKHPEKPKLRITVPNHPRDLKRKVVESIIDQAGMSIEEFLEYL